MRRFGRFFLAIAGTAFLGSDPAGAVPIVLTFEGLQDTEQVLEFYNGGTGSLGSSGSDLGISFGASALALIDSDAGGGGNFANEPSPDTIAFFLTGASLVMNVPAGFQEGFSFFYSSSVEALVTVYDGIDATGNVLGQVNLAAQGTAAEGCPLAGDPMGAFACWDPAGVSFAGIARSVDFSGVADQVGFDNITLESNIPIPEPTTGTLVGLGLLVVAARGGRLR